MCIIEEKRELIKYGEKLVHKGLVASSGGNISFKRDNKIFITPTGVSLDEISFDNLSEIDFESGKLINNIKPSKETNMHLSIYKRKNIKVIIHAHPFYTSVLASHKKIQSGKDIPYYSPGYAVKVGEVGLVNYFPPGSNKLAEAVDKALINKNAVLLKNHGIVVAENNFRKAFNLIEDIENNARKYLEYGEVINKLNKSLFEE